MKVHKRINYYHNRHRSDGILIEKREQKQDNSPENKEVIKSLNYQNNNNNINNNFYNSSLNFNKLNSMNKFKNELNLTEENMKNTSYQYQNNSFYNDLTNDENYLYEEYNITSANLIKNLSSLCKTLSRKENKKNKINEKIKSRENNYSNYDKIEEENIMLITENKKLEQEIKNLNNSISREPSQIDMEKLYSINRKLLKENEFYRSMINKIKISKSNEKMMNNSMKYKTDFLVQNMISSMKDLINLLDNENNINIKDSYMNTNLTLDNKSINYIPTENLDNFSQSSFTQENQLKDQEYS